MWLMKICIVWLIIVQWPLAESSKISTATGQPDRMTIRESEGKNQMATISFNQRITATPDTLVNQVSGESVLLNLGSEMYFGLDEVGTSMWQALTSSGTIQQAYE